MDRSNVPQGGIIQIDDDHLRFVANLLRRGRVTPFIGAGVNNVSSDPSYPLPTGRGLARSLIDVFDLGDEIEDSALPVVAQYVDVRYGWGDLYEQLRREFTRPYAPNAVHAFLVAWNDLFGTSEIEGTNRHQLIVTTNYDDAIEQSFEAADIPIDVFSYVSHPEAEGQGKFRHTSPVAAEPEIIHKGRDYEFDFERPTLLKVHGTVDRNSSDDDAFVITEDHYIDYMTQTTLENALPLALVRRLKTTHILFMAYAMKDWNLRVFLQRIWGRTPRIPRKPWAVLKEPRRLEKAFWESRHIDIVSADVFDYVNELSEHLGLSEQMHE